MKNLYQSFLLHCQKVKRGVFQRNHMFRVCTIYLYEHQFGYVFEHKTCLMASLNKKHCHETVVGGALNLDKFEAVPSNGDKELYLQRISEWDHNCYDVKDIDKLKQMFPYIERVKS